MAVNFTGETWLYLEAKLKKAIENNTAICINPEKSYKDVLAAQGAILALKSILNLPQEPKLLAATRKQ